MYTALGASRLLRYALTVFAIVIVAIFWLSDQPQTLSEVAQALLKAVGTFMTVLTALFGSSWYWSPWRLVWRTIPALNRWIFPDLNGLWLGSTNSNWPVIDATRKAALGDGHASAESLAGQPLQSGKIAIQIRASLFRIALRSRVAATKGESRSLFATLELEPKDREFQLIYLYQQFTPDPLPTDEELHVGAASLRIRDNGELTLDGSYWTRRKWREGLNTAGQIDVKRVDQHHVGSAADLIGIAQAQSTKAKHAAHH